jgi:transport inhibitor response 1
MIINSNCSNDWCDDDQQNVTLYFAHECISDHFFLLYRSLKSLDLTENKVDTLFGTWLVSFPPVCTSLVSLNLENIQGDIDSEALQSLVGRCTNLKSLKLNNSISLMQMLALIQRTPQLAELGTGSFTQELTPQDFSRLQSCIGNCRSLTSLCGFWEVRPGSLQIIYPVCKNLISLNLSYTPVDDSDFAELVSQCHNLQRLWVSPILLKMS